MYRFKAFLMASSTAVAGISNLFRVHNGIGNLKG